MPLHNQNGHIEVFKIVWYIIVFLKPEYMLYCPCSVVAKADMQSTEVENSSKPWKYILP